MTTFNLYYLVKDDPFYVGVTVNPKNRYHKHCRKKKEHLPFKLEVIYSTVDESEIIEMEHEYREANPHFINVSVSSYSYQQGRGELVGNAILTEEDVEEIRDWFFEEPFIGYENLAKEYDTSPSNIVNVLKANRQWQHAKGISFNDPKAYMNFRRFEKNFGKPYGDDVIYLLSLGHSMRSIWTELELPCHWSYLPRLKKKFLAYNEVEFNQDLSLWESPIILYEVEP